MSVTKQSWTMVDLRRDNLRVAGALGVVQRIAADHGVDLAHLLGGDRHEPVVRARDHAVAVLRWSTGWSLPHLGRLFGMDHTSIMLAVRRHDAVLNPAAPS